MNTTNNIPKFLSIRTIAKMIEIKNADIAEEKSKLKEGAD